MGFLLWMPEVGDTVRLMVDDDTTHPDSEGGATARTIRIVLADDHPVVRRGLRLLLDEEADFEVVAEAGDVEEARRYVRGHHPTVLVLDLNMPGGPSLEAIPQLCSEFPATHIVVLTMQQEPAYAREALAAGATGYVLKQAADGELVEAVRLAAVGESYLNPRLGARVAAEPPPGPPDNLSEREVERLAADRARSHQHGDRRSAVHLRANSGDSPCSHLPEAVAVVARRVCPLRARPRARQRLKPPSSLRAASENMTATMMITR